MFYYSIENADVVLSDHDLLVWCIVVPDPGRALKKYLPLVSEEERRKADRYRFEPDKVSFIVRRAALRIGLGSYLNVSPETVQLKYSDKGKPIFDGEHKKKRIYFNAAHSGKYILLGFTRLSELGVDIEWIGSFPEIDRMAYQFFTKNEYESIRRLPDGKKAVTFYCYWTRKEAVLKAMGVGVSQLLSTVDVSGPEGILGSWPGIEVLHKREKWTIVDLRVSAHVAAAIALKSHPFELTCREYTA